MIDFSKIQALTFDCYGTLIDWESGILAALRPLYEMRGGGAFHDETFLKAYGQAEIMEQRRPYRPYRKVLARVSRILAARIGAQLLPGEDQILPESVKDWPAFPDTAAALLQLSKRFRLIVCSNIDRDLFEGTRRHLGSAPLELISAEDVQSYKPAPAHFQAALRLTGLPAQHICHVAQSLFHDIGTARALGFHTVWINRHGKNPGSGITPLDTAPHDLRFNTLQELVDHIGS